MRRGRPVPILCGVALLCVAFVAPHALTGERSSSSRAQQVPEEGTLGGPRPGLSPAEMERWLRGRELFDHDFHMSDGLGAPDFNADSCRACHQDPEVGGSGGLELNVSRFARDYGGAGPFENLPGGQVIHKLRAPWVGGREELPPEADVFEQRQSPSLFGLGRIESIPDAAILANEDPGDADQDGVFGVARRVDVGGVAPEIGRFGWKAQIPSLADFVKDAMHVECGITTPVDGRGFALAADGDAAPDPEVTQPQVEDLAFFLRELDAPRRVGSQDPQVFLGETLFVSTGCATCHVPSLPDGEGQPVFLYSDLLLHDVWPTTFRGMEEPGAPAGVYRTPPLWGIRHTAPYMHDGRAETLSDAIEAHAGEAESAANRFRVLTPSDRAALLLFLADL